ncbi:hypothetical protein Tco_0143374, partial [Tanacetum coccineum]
DWSKVNITPARPQLVPTGKPKVPTPVPTGRQNWPIQFLLIEEILHQKILIIQEAEPKDTSGDEVDDSPLDSAEEIFLQELARLKGQEQRATSNAKDAEELQKRASTKIVPFGSIPVPTGSIPIPSSDTTISLGGVPVPTGSPTDSFFNDEPTTRFPSPS